MNRNFLALWIALSAAVASSGGANAGQTLDAIRERGHLACGVGRSLLGFMQGDREGSWRGLSVDMCRALAVALFGKADKVKFVPLGPAGQYSALRKGEVDVLASNAAFTLQHDTTDGADLAGIFYYDRQGFLAPRKAGKRRIEDLEGATVCVEAGGAAELAVADHFRGAGMAVKLLAFDQSDDLQAAFFNGKCDVFSAGFLTLHVMRMAYAPDPGAYVILPAAIAKVPIGLTVRQGDHQLADIARWVIYAMIEAEEYGVTSTNVGALTKTQNSAVKRLLGVLPGIGKALGVADSWAFEIVRQVGNYGEVYDRNLGRGSPLNIPRGMNLSWREGGMLYAPPIR
jgi:general L-amino acid transport system substrate-binding protein